MTHPLTSENQTKPSEKRFWIVAFSILLNCFLIGLLAAPYLSPHPRPPFMPPHFDDRMTKDLSAADAEALRAIFAEQENALINGRQGIDEAMRKLSYILSQPQVDPVALQNQLDAVVAVHTKIQEAMSDLIHHAATDLSPEGRRIFAREGLPPRPEDRHGPPPDHF